MGEGSKIAAIIKALVPPIVLETVRKARGRHYNWRGVYRSFADVPTHGRGYNDERYVTAVREHLRRLQAAAPVFPHVSSAVLNEEALLPLVSAVLSRQRRGPLRILDFGGGTGHCYEILRQSLTPPMNVDYHIVDLQWVEQEGPGLFPGDGSIHFHTSIPADLGSIDILFMRGVLMSVEDYGTLLKDLCALRPEWLLIVNLPVGEFRTFASAQVDHYGSAIAHWFFNLEEIVDIMNGEGYSLLFRGAHEDRYDLSNFPQEFRLKDDRASNLLFAFQQGAEPQTPSA